MLVRRYGRRSGVVWLLVLGFPLSALLGDHVSSLHLALTLLGFATVVALCSILFLDLRMSRATARGILFVLFAVGVAMTAYDRVGWATVLVYCAAAMSVRRLFAERAAVTLVIGCSATAMLLALLRGASPSTVISVAISCMGVGLLMVTIGQLRARNVELVSAREELARLAVADERLRFARDMHDLLGHSLSVIALKAELAGRLIERDAAAAATHIGELETVARGALADVRAAVSGYRRPALSAELDGARMALGDAGIQTRVVASNRGLSPEVEALLAWTVREGATNVIRHSNARNCSVVIQCGPELASAEVTDDGRRLPDADRGAPSAKAPPAGDLAGGHGLAGLRERAQRLSGMLEAGASPQGGFRLSVTVPLHSPEPAG